MTLDYASPEQVRGEPITTATDVYSLGVLLYKLLTGKSPYGLAARSDSALRKAICEQEPLKPSAVVLTDEKAVIPDATQKIDLTHEETRDKARRRLKKKLAGDLDMIVLMALRKEPLRRYASVEQFSEDIRRYLGRPSGHRPERYLRLPGREIPPPQCSGRRRGLGGRLDPVRRDRVRAAVGRALRTARLRRGAAAQGRRSRIPPSAGRADGCLFPAGRVAKRARCARYVQNRAGFGPGVRADPRRIARLPHAFWRAQRFEVGNLAPEEALDLFTDARSRLDALAETGTVGLLRRVRRTRPRAVRASRTCSLHSPVSAGRCRSPKGNQPELPRLPRNAIWPPRTSG